MSETFVPGQRWLSEAEPDLGLGVIAETDGRHVQLRFGASGQRRNYAVASAPLSRVRFEVDDDIEDQAGQVLTVLAVEEQLGLLRYRCVNARGDVVELAESMLNDHLQLNRPQDRLLARRIDPDIWFSLRYQTWLQTADLWRAPGFGLQGARVDLVPHQLHIATEVASRIMPRVLLADEVGLGKTIEAGLILHRLVQTERVRRVLIVVPDALVNQWLVEMLRRFNLRFALFDTERFEAVGAGNPFETEQRVLCSLSFLMSSAAVSRAVLACDWDLLIVDEAHHLEWSERASSTAYDLIEALSGCTPGMLLLTATPEQLGRAGHFGRLRLLDPQRFHDYSAFVAEEEAYAPVAALAARLIDDEVLAPEQQAYLKSLLGDEADLPRDQIIARLIDRHGTGRVLFRNTRQAIEGFPARELQVYPLDSPVRYRDSLGDPQPESTADAEWCLFDPRVVWLQDTLVRLAPDKVLVICAHAATAMGLRDHLLERAAIHVAMFHEDMEIVARDRAAAFFAETENGAQALICSEIGSEGRNFQFAHHLVLFDLPLEPDLLEQRIGRLDRIGQRETIRIHVPYMRGSAGEVLMRWYRDGLGSFTSTCPAAAVVYAQLGDALSIALRQTEQADGLIDEAARLTGRINAELEVGRDRLLELHSHQPRIAADLVEALRDPIGRVDLGDYMARYWDAFGVEHEEGPGASTILRSGAHMLSEHFPGLDLGAATVTFDRVDALVHEDRQFLTWEHPMVRGCMDMLSSDELGGAAVSLCSHPDYRTGTVFVEVLCIVECPAPPGLEVQRYLPPTCVRLLLDAQGEDHADKLAHQALQGLCLSQNHKLVETVLKSQGARLKPLLAHAETLAEKRAVDLVTEAGQRLDDLLDGERQRLRALAKINPNVRDDEIEQWQARHELIEQHLAKSRVRLDAVRLVVMR